MYQFLVGRAGFEPAKAEPLDLQSSPFDRFGTDPFRIWSRLRDSNPEPAVYKTAALPIELSRLVCIMYFTCTQ